MSNIQYEYVDESSIDENYKCSICNEPFKHPVTTSCDHSYCQECIEHWLNEGYSSCPTCRHILSMDDLKPVTTRLVLNILDRLLVKCSECGHSGIQRGNFNDHITKLCPKGTIVCSASDIKCPWFGPRDQLQNHLINCNYEQLRPVLSYLVNNNRRLEEQVQTLTNQVQTLQSTVQSPTRRLITFDKLFEIEKKVDSGALSESYEGLRWINVWYMHEQWVKANHALSGWKNAYTNGHICIAFNGKGSSMSICTRRQGIDTFSIISLEATAAWLNNLQVDVIGRRVKQDIYTTTMVLQFDTSQIFNLDWEDIDEIQFIPISGTSHPGIPYTEKYFAITWILFSSNRYLTFGDISINQNTMTTPIPQPEGTFLIGNASELDPNFTLGSFQRLQKLYGDIYRLTVLGRKIVIVSGQEIVNFICDESKFDKKVAEPVKELRHAGGDGLFTAHTSEPNWKLAHKILMPAFGPQAIRDMFPSMMDICSQLILRWERFAGEEIDVPDNLTRLTLDTIALCSFNYRFNSFYQEKMHRFVDAMINILEESARRVQRFPLQNTLMIRTSRKYFDDIAYIHNLCDEIVQQRREHPNDINDLLNRMINGKDSDTGYQLSDENIRYQMITFLVAGHETTSGLLSFTLYYLLKNPQALEKARAEADQYDEITINTLSKLKYIDAVLKETLRLQPTAPIFALQLKEDSIILPGGYEIHHDDSILVLLHELHRDSKVWDRPEEFLPERMLNGGYENLPPNSWKPFGNGQRACIGRPFAWQESLLSIALILKNFHMEFVDPSYDLRLKQTLTIKPAGFKIRVRSRQQISIPLGMTIKQTERIPEQKSQSIKNNNLRSMSILFGSNSGSCESFARSLASEVSLYGYNATVSTLDSAVGSLPNDQPVIIITASYEGKPCENAKQFVAYLESKPKLNINYAVFGAGHHDWVTTYQKIPIYIDEMIANAGGTRMIERGAGDSAGDFFGAFEGWKENLFQVLRQTSGIQNIIGEEKLSIEIVNSTRNLGQVTDVGIIKENKILVKANDINPTIRHMEIELPKGQTYRSGDYLAILPTNPIQVVHRVLQRFNLSTGTHIKIHSTTDTFFPTGHPVSAFDIISGYVELAQLISRKQIETLAALCTDENEQIKLANLAGDVYQAEILDKRFSVLDILELFPSCELPFSQYLRMLPSLRIRQYSISSSPLWNSESVTITFDIIDAPAFSGHGKYIGVASNYLATLKKGDRLSCTVRTSNVGFHLPADTKVPVIMIAAGTGIAPFRGFIKERAAQMICGRDIGTTILYYGCRTEQDFLYSNEFDKWSKIGALQIKTAFSRQSDGDKKYIQHLMWEDRNIIAKLYREGARFYICGSAKKLATSVKTCFIQIIANDQQCDEEKAAEILENISIDRYNVDVFT